MKKTLSCTTAAAALAVCLSGPVSADPITLNFTSDHCTGGCGDGSPAGQPGGFANVITDDLGNGTINITINLLNGNTFTGGGFPLSFGFNLIGDPTITYSNFNINGTSTTLFDVVNGPNNNTLVQTVGAFGMDGFGTFEYGIDYLGNGSSGSPPTTLSFSISGSGLDVGDFLELSTKPPGSDQANMVLDIASGTQFTNGNPNTGLVDYTTVSVPGPIVGAGIPGLIAACGGMFGLNFWRRRRNGNALPA
jgi:hypothetical protein